MWHPAAVVEVVVEELAVALVMTIAMINVFVAVLQCEAVLVGVCRGL